MPKALTTCCLAIALAAAPSLALAETMELEGPDGRTILLYDDQTWEYKPEPAPEPAAAPAPTTIDRDELVLNPEDHVGEEVVVEGELVEAFGAYRLTSKSGQNNIVVDIERIPADERGRLERAFDDAGWTGGVKAQVQGEVEEGNFGHRVLARHVLVAD